MQIRLWQCILEVNQHQGKQLWQNNCVTYIWVVSHYLYFSVVLFFLSEHYLNFLSKNWINWWYNFQKWTVMFNNVNVQVGKQQWFNTWSCLTKYILQDINYLYLTYSLYTKQIWSTIKQLTKTIIKVQRKGVFLGQKLFISPQSFIL